MAYNETPVKGITVDLYIILALVAIPTVLIAVLITAAFFLRVISKLKTAHEAELEIEFHRSFKAGYSEGVEYGRRLERLERMKKTRSLNEN